MESLPNVSQPAADSCAHVPLRSVIAGLDAGCAELTDAKPVNYPKGSTACPGIVIAIKRRTQNT